MDLLTYDEYIGMGGSIDSATFSLVIIDVESKLNFKTNGRIKLMAEIPQQIKRLVFKLVNLYATNNAQTTQPLSSYSNGIESFSYAVDSDSSKGSTSFDKKIDSIIIEYLYDYPELLYRGRVQWKQK